MPGGSQGEQTLYCEWQDSVGFGEGTELRLLLRRKWRVECGSNILGILVAPWGTVFCSTPCRVLKKVQMPKKAAAGMALQDWKNAYN
jgi:hypothetical protein